jgi:hypothetical protein
VVVVPKEPYDMLDHTVGVVRFIENGTVVVNDFRKEGP